MPVASSNSVLAFDVGLKRTGVAVGSQIAGRAQPLTTLAGSQGQLEWNKLDALIKEWQPSDCVVGDPNTDDPHLNKLIRRLIHHLQQHKITVHRVDETLTSASANSELLGHNLQTKQKTQLRDQIAACLILESFLSQQN